MSPNWKSSNDGHRCVLHQCQSVAVHFECLHGKMVCAVSKVYIKAQVESALIEVNDGFTVSSGSSTATVNTVSRW